MVGFQKERVWITLYPISWIFKVLVFILAIYLPTCLFFEGFEHQNVYAYLFIAMFSFYLLPLCIYILKINLVESSNSKKEEQQKIKNEMENKSLN